MLGCVGWSCKLTKLGDDGSCSPSIWWKHWPCLSELHESTLLPMPTWNSCTMLLKLVSCYLFKLLDVTSPFLSRFVDTIPIGWCLYQPQPCIAGGASPAEESVDAQDEEDLFSAVQRNGSAQKVQRNAPPSAFFLRGWSMESRRFLLQQPLSRTRKQI